MELLPEEIKELTDRLKSYMDCGIKLDKMLENILSGAGNKPERKDLVELFNSVRPAADEALVSEKTFSSDEQSVRLAVSQDAFDTYIGCMFDHYSRLAAIDKAFDDGELTEEDRKNLNIPRETYSLLTNMYGNESRDAMNIDILRIVCAQGIDSKADYAGDIINQMASNIYNMKLQDLLFAEFDKYAQYSDRELVNNWPLVFEKQLILSTASDILASVKHNPYVNTSLIEKVYDLESKYASQYALLQGRVKAIANANYGHVDIDTYSDIGSLDEGEAFRFDSEIKAIREAGSRMLYDRIFEVLKEKTGVSCKENMAVFDSFEEAVYAANLSTGELIAFNRSLLEKGLLQTVPVGDEGAEVKAEIDKISEGRSPALYDYIFGSEKSFGECMRAIAGDIFGKNLDKEEILSSIYQHLDSTGRSLSKEEYLQKFKSKGYTPEELSDDEISRRRELSKKVAKICVEVGISRLESGKAFEDKLTKETIEDFIQKHLQREALFDRQYSDEELIANWSELNETSALGIKYEQVKSFMRENGILLDPGIQTKADRFSRKVLAFNDYYSARANIIGSKYYQYGCTDLPGDEESVLRVMDGVADNEFVRLKNILAPYQSVKSKALGNYIVFLGTYTYKDTIGILNSDGDFLDANHYLEIGDLVREARNIVVVYSDQSMWPCILDGTHYPPTIEKAPALNSLEQKIADIGLCIHNIRVSDLKEYETEIQTETLSSQKEMLILSRDKFAPNFESRFKECVGKLCTNLTVQRMASVNQMSEEEIIQLTSQQNRMKFKEAANAAGLIEDVVNILRANIKILPKLEQDHFNKAIAHCNNQIRLKEKRATAVFREDQFIKFRDNSLKEAKRIRNAFRTVKEGISTEDFFGNSVSEAELNSLQNETSLKGMSVTGNAVSTLTLAIMLNMGYSADDALSYDAEEDRALLGNKAIELIRNNDVYKIRELLSTGLDKLNDYVNKELTNTYDYSPSEISMPEHRNMLAAGAFQSSMAREFEGCQQQLDAEDLLNIPKTISVCRRGNMMAKTISDFTSLYNPEDLSLDEISRELNSYVRIQLLNKYIQKIRDLPENRNRSFDEVADEDRLCDFEAAFDEISPNISIRGQYSTEACLQKIHEAIRDDTLKNNLNMNFKLPDRNNKKLIIEYTPEAALKNAIRRDPLDRELNINLEDFRNESEFRF